MHKFEPMRRVSGRNDLEGALARLGDAIRSQRLELGISQEALADEASVDRSHLGKIERGERNVTLLNVLKIARALNMKASDLLGNAGL